MNAPPGPSRYRFVEGRWCIDLRLKSPRHLFDNRDPAPFRERELDPEAVEYIVSSVAEVGTTSPVSLVLVFDEVDPMLPADVVAEAIRVHFRHEVERVEARLKTHWQRTRYLFAVGLSVLVAFLSLAEVAVHQLSEGPLRQILREGLVITGWVAMWRPLEALLYDWWPLVRQRRRLRHVVEAVIDIRHIGA
jgi:hypothetical protein